jgi:ferredoxin
VSIVQGGWTAAVTTARSTTPTARVNEHVDLQVRGGEFEVVLARTGRRLSIPVGTSILAVLERDGIRPDSSCLDGTCGTCETTVLEGVPDHRDSILDEEDRADGKTMMICVSRARSPRLVLDL